MLVSGIFSSFFNFCILYPEQISVLELCLLSSLYTSNLNWSDKISVGKVLGYNLTRFQSVLSQECHLQAVFSQYCHYLQSVSRYYCLLALFSLYQHCLHPFFFSEISLSVDSFQPNIIILRQFLVSIIIVYSHFFPQPNITFRQFSAKYHYLRTVFSQTSLS